MFSIQVHSNNRIFPPGSSDPGFGSITVKLTNPDKLIKQDLFCFLQIRQYIIHNTTLIDHLEISAVEKMLFQQQLKVSLSSFYCVLNGISITDTGGQRCVGEGSVCHHRFKNMGYHLVFCIKDFNLHLDKNNTKTIPTVVGIHFLQQQEVNSFSIVVRF